MIKKLLYLTCLAFVLVGCNDVLPTDTPSTTETSNCVSEEEALMQAMHFLNSGTSTRSKERNLIVKRCEKLPGHLISRSEDAPNGFYLFNFESNQGFVLISADKRDLGTVYLSAEDGNISLESFSLNSTLGYLKEKIDSLQRQSIKRFVRPLSNEDNIAQNITYVVNYDYPNLLDTKWHQSDPFNKYYFNLTGMNHACGCGPIAAAQIMAYYQHPQTVRVNSVTYALDWYAISQIKTGNENNSDYQILETSKLIYLVGKRANASFGESTSTTINNLASTFGTFGFYHSSATNYTYERVKNEIAYQRPVFMCGYKSSGAGHAWVVVGAKSITEVVRSYNDETGEPIENTIYNQYNWENKRDYLILNFGWGGSYSSYQSYVQITTSGELYPTHVNVISNAFNDYNNNNQIIYNIHPN